LTRRCLTAGLKPTPRWGAVLLALVCAAPALSRAGEDDPDAPPALGAPEDFSGAVGKYRIACTASPTEVAVEDPVKLVVRITGAGPKKYLPERAKLHLFPPELGRDFYVQNVPREDRYLPAERTWEFVYRLRPKRLGITRIPALQFVYYDPALRRFQPARTRGSIALKVTPRREAVLPKNATRVPPAPDRFYELATGEAVLSRSGHAGDAYPFLLACLILVPPGLCAVWYGLWRRLHPEAGWRARRRRSRAAREALAALRRVDAERAGERTASVLAGYLRQRLELKGAEPTPEEVSAHLGRAGVSAGVSGRVAGLFRACDAARFAPSPPAEVAALTANACDLVQALEAELCAAQAS
jgi:hypothetical protein